ncbi:helix-turn-helix domain-containing protein [Salmonella enterica]|nr:helix-turn-helix domain-containing protein [Salmonella enterica]
MSYEKKIVQHFVRWIEDHIEEDKTIDDLVNYTGYSRRAVQLMFKKEYGVPVGTYMRQRKMCRAATLLRLTKLSVIEIAHRVHFSGTQNFGRAFKHAFNMTPTEYRNLPSWDLSLLVPAINIDNCWNVDSCIVERSGIYVSGDECFYQQKILRTPTLESKRNRLKKIRHYSELYKTNIVIASNFLPPKNRYSAISDVIDITMLSGVEVEKNTAKNDTFYVEGGRYIKFVFNGKWSDYSKFSHYIYMNILPKTKLHRRSGADIELFHYTTNFYDDDPKFICDYFIPVD